MKIINKSKNISIADDAKLADDPISRLVGLLNRTSLLPSEALVITDCRSIHMFFMRFSIDVIFIDKKDIVIGLVPSIKPYRMSPYYIKAKKAIEIFPGKIEQTNTEIGDQIYFEK